MVGVTVNSVAELEFISQEKTVGDCCQSAVWLVSQSIVWQSWSSSAKKKTQGDCCQSVVWLVSQSIVWLRWNLSAKKKTSDCCQSAVWLVSVNSKAEMEFVSQEKPKVIVVGQQCGWCHSQ